MSQQQVAARKVEAVGNIKDMLTSYNTIGLVRMESIGAKTVQKLRADLRGRARIVVAKNTLMRKAIEFLGDDLPGGDKLNQYITGPVAFLFTNSSPYQIANYLAKNKVQAPAKSGQIAPISVTIPKMNTGFPPGTIISELNSVGLPTRIEGGTVAIPNDTQVLEPGDRVSTTLASILSRLGIEPFEVGLSLDLVLESGDIIAGNELLIDFDEYINDLLFAHQQAVNLSVNAGIITDVTAPMVIANAQQKAMAVAATVGYVTEDSAPFVFGRAQAHAIALMQAVLAIDSSAIPADVASLATVAAAPVASAPTATAEEEEEEEIEEEEEGELLDEEEELGSFF